MKTAFKTCKVAAYLFLCVERGRCEISGDVVKLLNIYRYHADCCNCEFALHIRIHLMVHLRGLQFAVALVGDTNALDSQHGELRRDLVSGSQH
uniref:HDC12560 n=1 Tax=Drosophila melanogaster TaxID=7227 RepID=Q6IKF6_DROME|nr:TPA_inf: HDC12560 [Drosophila melanogaster]